MKLRRIAATTALAAIAISGLAACGNDESPKMDDKDKMTSQTTDDKMNDDKMSDDKDKMNDDKMSDDKDKMNDDKMSDDKDKMNDDKMSDDKK